MINKLILNIALLFPAIAFAHSGHGVFETNHGHLHSEHTLMLASIIALVFIVRRIKRNHDIKKHTSKH
jgi:hypothetical protein